MRKRRASGQTLTLLQCLAERPREWRHGYELSKATALKSGTLYPILVRLADRGLLETQWQPAREPGRPPRHLYRLTTRGAEFVERELAARAPRHSFKVKVSRA
jgi:DNA-binding PadR family transcriptional regulator